MVSLRGSALGAAARQPLLALFLVGLAVFSFSGHAMVPKTVQELTNKLPGAHLQLLESALGWQDCKAGTVFRPSTTEQVADLVSELYKDSQASSQKYLIRATHPQFFSHNNFSCATINAGAEQTHTVVVDMSAMTQVLEYNREEETMTVQAGITFESLQSILMEYGLSLPGPVSPHLAGMMVGSALVTSAHGSSLVGPATIGPFLATAVMVDGTGEVHVLSEPGDLLEGSVGMLGLVTEVTLFVQPARKVAVRQLQGEDFGMVSDMRDIIDNSAAISLDVMWSPTAGMYTARVWHETSADTAGEARNVHLQPPQEWLEKINDVLQRDQMDIHDDMGAMCETIGALANFPTFEQTEALDDTTPTGTAVGWINAMSAASCPPGGCMWSKSKWTPHQLSIASEDFSAWLTDVKEVMAHAQGCPPFLFYFRFVGESDAPLALSSGRQAVSIEISTFSARRRDGHVGHIGVPLKFTRLHEEIVQMTLCKYGGRPHWALATNRLFLSACPVRDMYGEAFTEFLESRATYDPAGLFTPPLFQAVIAREQAPKYPGCALNGDCFCETDEHCGSGFRCVPGYVFTEYKVCAPPPRRTDEL